MMTTPPIEASTHDLTPNLLDLAATELSETANGLKYHELLLGRLTLDNFKISNYEDKPASNHYRA
jgi:hypothetical protein